MCDPVSIITAGAAVIGAGSSLSAAEDAEDQYHKQEAIAFQNAKHRREVSEYNAGLFTEQATRLRNEMADRISEVAGINILRLDETRNTNVSRIQEVLGINVDRVNLSSETNLNRIRNARNIIVGRAEEDFETLASRLQLDSETDIGRIKDISEETVRRLGKRAQEVATTGFEMESDLREQVEQDVASTRAFYAAGNIVVNSGTPMRMQLDIYQRGEIEAQRLRKDYRIRIDDLENTASDTMREALHAIEDITKETNRRITDAGVETIRAVHDAELEAQLLTQDVNTTTAFQLEDLHRVAGHQIEDMNRDTDLRIGDIERNLGYDLTDLEFEANKLDQQATLTLMQGDAAASAEMNRAEAFDRAGDDAISGGRLEALGHLVGGVSDVWYNSNSAASQAPVTESQPDFTRST